VGGEFRPVVAAPTSGRLVLRLHEAQFAGKVSATRLVAAIARLSHLSSQGAGGASPVVDCELAPVTPPASVSSYGPNAVNVCGALFLGGGCRVYRPTSYLSCIHCMSWVSRTPTPPGPP
jgi:hypothetical protein